MKRNAAVFTEGATQGVWVANEQKNQTSWWLSGRGVFFVLFLISVLFILLYNIVLVLPYIDINPPWVYMCSPSWTPLPPPSSPHPSGSSQCTNPSTLYNASNLDWRFFSHVIIYMFQCHSPISSHPRPLPQSPKDCSIHLCLFCCLTYRVIITIFLNSIYMHFLSAN